MIDLKLTKASGRLDIEVIDGALQFTDGDDELRQRVEFKLEFFQNDWFLDLLFGIPYYGRVFGKGVNISDLYGIFSDAIVEEPGVNSIRELDINLDATLRALSVDGVILSDTGVILNVDTLTGGL